MATLTSDRVPAGSESNAVADRARVADAAVLVQYLALLVSALIWVKLGFVSRFPNMRLFYVLLAAIFLYLCLRSYLTLVRPISERWTWVWPISDVVIVSVLVPVTGGLGSVAPFLYLLPLALCSIQHKPGRALAAGILGSVLYLEMTWYPHPVPGYWLQVGPRIAALALATSLAVINAAMEAARMEEVAAMREQLALADYRQRLSQEMHDGIQHDLVGLTVRLELARQLMADDPAQAARIAIDQRFVARQAADELRTLVYLLRSPAVEREGFVSALQHRLSLFAQRSAISARLHFEGDSVPLPPQAAHTAFRIIQEALTNAEKHSRASRVDVILRFGSDAFECAVKDDGIGFDVASVADRVLVGSGFGLGGMKQRADLVGGWLRVDSQPDAGTEIAFGFPLEASPK